MYRVFWMTEEQVDRAREAVNQFLDLGNRDAAQSAVVLFRNVLNTMGSAKEGEVSAFPGRGTEFVLDFIREDAPLDTDAVSPPDDQDENPEEEIVEEEEEIPFEEEE